MSEVTMQGRETGGGGPPARGSRRDASSGARRRQSVQVLVVQELRRAVLYPLLMEIFNVANINRII